MKHLFLTLSVFTLFVFNSFAQTCSIVQETGGLNTGFACDQSGSFTSGIDDFAVPPGETWGITTVKANLITSANLITNPQDFEVSFYIDQGGFPTYYEGSYQIPGSYTATYLETGDLGIGDTYEFTFNLDHIIDLEGDQSGAMYWVSISCYNGNPADRYYWEVDTVANGSYGLNCGVSNDSGVNWAGGTNADFVFEFDYFMHATDAVQECGTFTWTNGNGNTYTSNAHVDYTVPGGALNGCDSVLTLDLIISPLGTSTATHTSCEPFTWIDGNTYSSSNNTAQFVIPGGSQNGCDSVITLDLTINPVTATAIDNGDGTLTASGGATVQWIECSNNSPISGATSATFSPMEDGNYAAIVSNGNCSDTSACVTFDYVGLSNTPKIAFVVFPNPSNDNVTIYYSGTVATITVFDQRGSVVLTNTIAGNMTFDVKSLANGVYTIELSTGTSSTKQRLVKL